jgi:hypothetical protein
MLSFFSFIMHVFLFLRFHLPLSASLIEPMVELNKLNAVATHVSATLPLAHCGGRWVDFGVPVQKSCGETQKIVEP